MAIRTEDILQERRKVLAAKMDFMAQEMNREANTILSKSNDLEVSNIAIDLKTEIEKIREQIQNIE
ncbi:MAG: endoribonuclease YicC domain-containing protein [Blautia massiliensis (ex Durand et al. 2017)]